ncbi:Chromosome transmission fidelity protein 8 [Dimargaris xerosporica]|nr:Chromosome transmission fidelity protein 8 [Dimargaris xerosporica]
MVALNVAVNLAPAHDPDEGLQAVFFEDQPFLIELQGSLQRDGDSGFAGQTIGTLKLAAGQVQAGQDAQLTIGQHQLRGKVEKLKKPFAYLQQSPDQASDYTIQHIIRYKIIFKDRPFLVLQT